MTPRLARIAKGDRQICCARLMDGTARYCRKLATTLILAEDTERYARVWGSTGAPYCDHHLRREIREMEAAS